MRTHRTPTVIAAVVAVWGAAAAVRYQRLGLTLAHFDARAHLVVARRIFDNLIPGWQQVGAVWLPLPHLLNALPVQIDYLYQTGYSAVGISIASMAVASWAIATLIHDTTGSWVGGACAAALLMLNPDMLYLQSTPMSEPLLFGATFLAIALTAEWTVRESGPPSPDANATRLGGRASHPTTRAAGWALVAAALSRFEAWPIIAALLVLSVVAFVARGSTMLAALRRVRGLALWPLWTVAAFLVDSKITVGRWFVASGFFVPENPAMGHPWTAWTQVWRAFLDLTGPILPWIGVAAVLVLCLEVARHRERAPLLLVLSLAACAATIGTAVALLPRRLQAASAVVVIAIAAWQAPPFERRAAVVTESLRDEGNSIGRQAVTVYFLQHWDHQPIMMSMGSLAHYMQDLSAYGFDVKDFLHEGDGEIWRAAMEHPRPFVEWIAIDEIGRGGDALYWRGKRDPAFLAGYARVAEGGGVALYRRR